MSKPKSSSVPLWMQEEEIPGEYRSIISSFPRESGWGERYLYQYEGFWQTEFMLLRILECQKHFQVQDSDIILACNPKCGTTWLKSLAFAILNRKHYPPTDNQHPLLSKNSHELLPNFDFNVDYDDKQCQNDHQDFSFSSNNATTSLNRLLACHLPYVSLPKSVRYSACKLIYICRNPKGAFISRWHFTNKMRTPEMGTLSLEDAFDKFCRGVCSPGPFWDHVLGYWKQSVKCPEKFLFLKYEELREETNFHVKRIAEFMGCPFSEEEEASGIVDEIVKLCSFNNLSNLEVNKSGKHWSGTEYNALFRRGVVEDWKNYLTPEMADRLDHLTAEKLHGSGLQL